MEMIDRQAAIEALERKLAEPYHTGEDWYVGINCAEVEIYGLPSAQPDTYEALRILDAIRSSGRLDYGDYCDLHDAISEIGGAQNG